MLENRHARVDLVLLDILMPGIKGTDVYHRSRQLRPDLPVVFCTAVDPEQEEIEFAVREKIVIRKPTTPETLLRTVRRELDRCKSVPGGLHGSEMLCS